MFATALGGGILLDATLIRGVLAPAVVALLGRWNWWLPPRAARVLRVAPEPLANEDVTSGGGAAQPAGIRNEANAELDRTRGAGGHPRPARSTGAQHDPSHLAPALLTTSAPVECAEA